VLLSDSEWCSAADFPVVGYDEGSRVDEGWIQVTGVACDDAAKPLQAAGVKDAVKKYISIPKNNDLLYYFLA